MTTVTPGNLTPALQDQSLTAPPRAVAPRTDERTPPPRAVAPRTDEPTPLAAPGRSAQAAKSDQATNERPLEFEVGAELKLRVRFDEPAGRFVYMGVNTESGEIERQYPPDEALRMIARMHETVGQKLDEEL
jgi:hypothetical protein